jgi:hypothetical protein
VHRAIRAEQKCRFAWNGKQHHSKSHRGSILGMP